MALISCLGCKAEVTDAAAICVRCDYPLTGYRLGGKIARAKAEFLAGYNAPHRVRPTDSIAHLVFWGVLVSSLLIFIATIASSPATGKAPASPELLWGGSALVLIAPVLFGVRWLLLRRSTVEGVARIDDPAIEAQSGA